MSDDESEDSNESEEDDKALVSSISSDISIGEIYEYDVFADNYNDPSQLVSYDPSCQTLFDK